MKSKDMHFGSINIVIWNQISFRDFLCVYGTKLYVFSQENRYIHFNLHISFCHNVTTSYLFHSFDDKLITVCSWYLDMH